MEFDPEIQRKALSATQKLVERLRETFTETRRQMAEMERTETLEDARILLVTLGQGLLDKMSRAEGLLDALLSKTQEVLDLHNQGSSQETIKREFRVQVLLLSELSIFLKQTKLLPAEGTSTPSPLMA